MAGGRKRLVDADKLRKLHFSEVVIHEAEECEHLGWFDVDVSPELLGKFMERITEEVGKYATECIGESIGAEKAWEHFLHCWDCRRKWEDYVKSFKCPPLQ